ncbi:hypothetical protein CPT_Moonbeam193 [Bacillus phage Moonbeam]|uniref:Uncharacterized protein n=1 Tax=Bacillus phage Moonbeam TaxID=1540091 RepID=A0A0A0RSS6_9CAUD|nr:hypothetical protein CPT_Moonbeam193 [Bacillus phage Moonbeam]AIW03591.1 hypothetical protein CPT_Moonbeam193 [Bacillus phage Moonbeam]
MTNKKDLKKKNISSSSVLVQLYNNPKLRSKVENMLDEGQTYDYIQEYLSSKNFSMSKASLTNYKKKREESIETGQPLIQLLDKRAKDNVSYIADKEVKPFSTVESTSSSSATVHDLSKRDSVYSDLELLDETIRKSMKGLKQFDVVDLPLGMKAIELKAKLTGNSLNGLSLAGLRELHLRQAAKEAALIEVIMKYVPEDLHIDVFQDLENSEKEFFENLDLTEEEKRISAAIRRSGLGL